MHSRVVDQVLLGLITYACAPKCETSQHSSNINFCTNFEDVLCDIDIVYHWLSDISPLTTKTLSKSVRSDQHIQLLLIISGQVESDPGPYKPKYPCQVCTRAVKWVQRALACDNCDNWCHVSCMSMTSDDYQLLSNTSTTWFCKICDAPNYSRLYDSIPVSENSYSHLRSSSHTPLEASHSSIGSPIVTSSPRCNHQHRDMVK